MSILEKYSAALKNKDEAVMNELLHDDFKFTMHKSGNVLTKSDVIKWAMSGDINQDKVRIVYENCLLYTSPSPRDRTRSRMPSSA